MAYGLQLLQGAGPDSRRPVAIASTSPRIQRSFSSSARSRRSSSESQAASNRSGRRARVSCSWCQRRQRAMPGVVAALEHVGDRDAAELGGPGVLRVLQQPVLEALGAGGVRVAQHAGEQPRHRVDDGTAQRARRR